MTAYTLPDPIPSGWDAADAIAAGWDRRALVAFIKSFEPIETLAPAEQTGDPRPDPPPHDDDADDSIPVTPPPAGTPIAAFTATGQPNPRLLSSMPDSGDNGRSSRRNVHFLIQSMTMGALAYNLMEHRIYVTARPPWDTAPWRGMRHLSESDGINCTTMLEHFGISVARSVVEEILYSCAVENAFNPITDYLNGLPPPETPYQYLDNWLVKFGGATNTPLNRAFGRRFLIACVARQLDPGCKVDTVLVLEGSQGIGKSTLVETLCGPEYFLDSLPDLKSKDSSQLLSGSWIIELAEGAAYKKTDIDASKAFITRRVEKFRPPFAKHPISQPRRCTFVMTRNPDGYGYLNDRTGNRRYWPVELAYVDVSGLRAVRDQLWAEAVHAYETGERWWLDDTRDADLIETAIEAAEERVAEDPWTAAVADYVDGHATKPPLNEVSITEIAQQVLGVPMGQVGAAQASRIGQILQKDLGWHAVRKGESRRRRYYRFNPIETGQYTPKPPVDKSAPAVPPPADDPLGEDPYDLD